MDCVGAGALSVTYSAGMTDEIDSETQWTAAARETYTARGKALLEALREHIAVTLDRSGRQAEHSNYIASAARLHDAASAFDEAEFDWCGSFPLGLDPERWDDDDDDQDEGDTELGSVLTVVGRWDYRIVDESALIDAGRAAYARMWADDTEEDAALAVANPAAAAQEIAHADGWNALDDTAGLQPLASTQTVILHEREDAASWFDTDEDPFDIVREG